MSISQQVNRLQPQLTFLVKGGQHCGKTTFLNGLFASFRNSSQNSQLITASKIFTSNQNTEMKINAAHNFDGLNNLLPLSDSIEYYFIERGKYDSHDSR
jgi:hypothetical protein